MIASFAATHLPYIKDVAGGTRIIILTVLISLIFAIIKPIDNEPANETDTDHTNATEQNRQKEEI